MSSYDYQPTLLPKDDFDASVDSQALRSAMKGLGTDEDAIIDILSTRAGYQRLEIVGTYKTQFGRDLIDDVKDELKGNFEDVIVALLTPTPKYLAGQVHKSISGAGTDEASLIEILVPLTNREMDELKDEYKRLYGESLEEALKGDTGGHFEKMLVSLANAQRDLHSEMPSASVAIEAQKIYEAGEDRWGTDESAFLTCLNSHSFPQLIDIFDHYETLSSSTIESAIESELSGDYKDCLLSIVNCARNTPEFFARRLYKAMKTGLGTDDETLIRIVITRCEQDMQVIKREFQKNYEKPLEDFIADETSGDYKKILLKLIAD